MDHSGWEILLSLMAFYFLFTFLQTSGVLCRSCSNFVYVVFNVYGVVQILYYYSWMEFLYSVVSANIVHPHSLNLVFQSMTFILNTLQLVFIILCYHRALKPE